MRSVEYTPHGESTVRSSLVGSTHYRTRSSDHDKVDNTVGTVAIAVLGAAGRIRRSPISEKPNPSVNDNLYQ